jgi:hypothetical protein
MYFCHLGKFGIEVVHVFDGLRTSITSVVFPSDSVPGFALPHVIMRNLFVVVVKLLVMVILDQKNATKLIVQVYHVHGHRMQI